MAFTLMDGTGAAQAVMESAIRLGDTGLAKALNARGCPYVFRADEPIDWALIQDHHLEMATLLYLNGRAPLQNLRTLEWALNSGSTDLVKLMHDNKFSFEISVCTHGKDTTAMSLTRDLDMIKCLHEHVFPANGHNAMEFAKRGMVDVMAYMFDNNHVKIVDDEYATIDLYNDGVVWFSDTMHKAMHAEQMHMVRYLHEHGCPGLDTSVIDNTIHTLRGKIDNLKRVKEFCDTLKESQ